MLNYIWGGLIVSSLLFAIGYDLRDLATDRYRNGTPLPLVLTLPPDYSEDARVIPVEIRISPEGFSAHYGLPSVDPQLYEGRLIRTEEGMQLRFPAGASLPEPLGTIASVSSSNDDELQGELVEFVLPDPVPAGGESAAQSAEEGLAPGTPPLPVPEVIAQLRFEPVRFVKLTAVSAAALSFAQTAAEIALGLIGVLALFLGLLKIGEEAGIVQALVRFVRPVLRPLFPGIPEDHPALGMIALNLTANMFGLGNAATPFGIRAMQELQKLNPSEETATNAMVTFLAINTASVQILPPVLLIALMGLQINQLVIPIIMATGLSLVVAIAAAKLYERLPSSRRSNPEALPPAAEDR